MGYLVRNAEVAERIAEDVERESQLARARQQQLEKRDEQGKAEALKRTRQYRNDNDQPDPRQPQEV